MIQRIQSLYILLSTILGVVCLSMPLGYFSTEEGERVSDLFNLWFRVTETGAYDFSPWALFALLVLVTTVTFLDIFLFRHRALQMRALTMCMVLLVGYYAFLAFLVYKAKGDVLTYTPSLTAAFPLVCIILDYLAFRGILKDEMLVRSLDRLR